MNAKLEKLLEDRLQHFMVAVKRMEIAYDADLASQLLGRKSQFRPTLIQAIENMRAPYRKELGVKVTAQWKTHWVNVSSDEIDMDQEKFNHEEALLLLLKEYTDLCNEKANLLFEEFTS